MPPPSIYDNIRGFTLVELAISLMIIGLLIGSILKGDELVENARSMKYVLEIKEYDAAVGVFLSKYDNWPGDMPNPGRLLPDCAAAPCSLSGNADGFVNLTAYLMPAAFHAAAGGVYNLESSRFFVHLTKAGLIRKKVDADYSGGWSGTIGVEYPAIVEKEVALSAMAYHVNVNWGVPATQGNYYVMRPIATAYAFAGSRAFYIDQKLDDGVPGRGNVRAGSSNSNDPNISANCASVTEYNMTATTVSCNLIVKINP